MKQEPVLIRGYRVLCLKKGIPLLYGGEDVNAPGHETDS